MMTLDLILDVTKPFNPTVYTEACDDYPTLKEGDVVFDYTDDLALIYENGKYQITYGDWLGDYKNPLPVLMLILEGNAEVVEQNGNVELLVLDEVRKEEDDDLVYFQVWA